MSGERLHIWVGPPHDDVLAAVTAARADGHLSVDEADQLFGYLLDWDAVRSSAEGTPPPLV